MEYTKVYYLIEVINKNKNGTNQYQYYGKKGMHITDIYEPWYIKEYGFDTAGETYRILQKVAKWYNKNGFEYSGMQIVDTKVKFVSYEEYLRIVN